MKVAELIEWLQTLEPDWEIGYHDNRQHDNYEEISHIHVNEMTKTYTLE